MKLKELFCNPMGFFITLFMTVLMPLIVAIPFNYMDYEILLNQWIFRWAAAYFLVSLIVVPISLRLAIRLFTIPPKNRFLDYIPFFASLFMSFLMPLIVAIPFKGMTWHILFIYWINRWIVAYALVAYMVKPISIKLSEYFFNFEFPKNS